MILFINCLKPIPLVALPQSTGKILAFTIPSMRAAATSVSVISSPSRYFSNNSSLNSAQVSMSI